MRVFTLSVRVAVFFHYRESMSERLHQVMVNKIHSKKGVQNGLLLEGMQENAEIGFREGFP